MAQNYSPVWLRNPMNGRRISHVEKITDQLLAANIPCSLEQSNESKTVAVVMLEETEAESLDFLVELLSQDLNYIP